MNKSKKYTNKKLKKFRKTKRGGSSWFSRIFGTSNSAKPNATLTQTPTLNAKPNQPAKPNATPNAKLNATPNKPAIPKPNPILSPTTQSQIATPNPTLSPKMPN